MDIIDKKNIKDKNNVINELKLYCDQLESFGKGFSYSSHKILQPSI